MGVVKKTVEGATFVCATGIQSVFALCRREPIHHRFPPLLLSGSISASSYFIGLTRSDPTRNSPLFATLVSNGNRSSFHLLYIASADRHKVDFVFSNIEKLTRRPPISLPCLCPFHLQRIKWSRLDSPVPSHNSTSFSITGITSVRPKTCSVQTP